MITYRILSPKVFNEIYKGLEQLTGEKPKKVKDGCYITKTLKEQGFTQIKLTNKKINASKYKYNFMQISIILNPAKLIGFNKLEVIKINDLEEVKKVFREKIKEISLNLPRLEHWTINRIDYAINIKTPYAAEYIKLFQRGDKPKNLKELYCSKSKARKQLEGSFYLFNNSVTINFYDKENERLKENFNIDGAKDLLRLEVQCKKTKTNTIKAKNKFDSRLLEHYLSEQVSKQQIKYYYNNTIGTGDYYKLSKAIKIVEDSKYTPRTKEKLIEVLKAINKSRSIWKAREKSNYNCSCFNRYLNQLRALGVNPVTIPCRWNNDKLDNIISNLEFMN